jgi:hypothetical protein
LRRFNGPELYNTEKIEQVRLIACDSTALFEAQINVMGYDILIAGIS